MTEIRVEMLDEVGNYLETITEIVSLDCAVSFNNVGTMTLQIPDDRDLRDFRRDYQFRIYIETPGQPPQQFAYDTFFLNKASRRGGLITLSAPDAMMVLANTIIAYTGETTYADKTQEEWDLASLYYQYGLYIDDMMRAYVRENLGPLAIETDRINSFLSIEEDRGLAPLGQKTASFAVLLGTLQDLARQAEEKGTPLFFNLWPDGEQNYIFRVWSNQARVDRSSTSLNPLVLMEETGDIEEVEETYDWSEEGNVVYGLGGGSGSARLYVRKDNAASLRGGPFARREFTHDMPDVDNIDAGNAAWVDGELGAALQGKRPRVRLSANVSEGGELVYGRDFGYGDKIVVVTGFNFYRQYDVYISAARLSFADGKLRTAMNLTGVDFLNG